MIGSASSKMPNRPVAYYSKVRVPATGCGQITPDPSLGLLLESRKRLLSEGPSAPTSNAATRGRPYAYSQLADGPKLGMRNWRLNGDKEVASSDCATPWVGTLPPSDRNLNDDFRRALPFVGIIPLRSRNVKSRRPNPYVCSTVFQAIQRLTASKAKRLMSDCWLF